MYFNNGPANSSEDTNTLSESKFPNLPENNVNNNKGKQQKSLVSTFLSPFSLPQK